MFSRGGKNRTKFSGAEGTLAGPLLWQQPEETRVLKYMRVRVILVYFGTLVHFGGRQKEQKILAIGRGGECKSRRLLRRRRLPREVKFSLPKRRRIGTIIRSLFSHPFKLGQACFEIDNTKSFVLVRYHQS